MKICPKCSAEHSNTGVYCSRKCANSRTFTEESRRKKSTANRQHWHSLSEQEQTQKKQLLEAASRNAPRRYAESIMTQDWDVLGLQGKRLRVILEQNGRCNKCGTKEWNGEQITLEYEHKDGNNTNNARENVEALCPNCHSQTTTWRGRKNKNCQKRIERYIDLLPTVAQGEQGPL